MKLDLLKAFESSYSHCNNMVYLSDNYLIAINIFDEILIVSHVPNNIRFSHIYRNIYLSKNNNIEQTLDFLIKCDLIRVKYLNKDKTNIKIKYFNKDFIKLTKKAFKNKSLIDDKIKEYLKTL